MDLICLYGLIDNLGALLGIGSNSLLIWIIFRVAKGKLQLYSYLVLISSIFDLFFSVIEVITQHQLLVRHGILFVMAHGIESQLGDWAHYFCMIPHIFSCTHSVLILGPQFFYRMDLVTGTSPSLCTLLKYTAVSSAASLFVGCSAGVGIFQAKQRGFDYYMAQMDGPWFNEKAKRFLTYACDIRDIGTICFYGGALVFTTICFWMSVYAVWKTFSFIRDSSSQLSERTAALQRQFTIRDVEVFGCFVTYDLISIRYLIAQTINAFVFAVIPVSQICISMLLRLDLEFVGIGTMVPLSWLSFANAMLTCYIVKAYRRELCLFLPCRFTVDVHPSTTQTTKLTTNTEKLSSRQTGEN